MSLEADGQYVIAVSNASDALTKRPVSPSIWRSSIFASVANWDSTWSRPCWLRVLGSTSSSSPLTDRLTSAVETMKRKRSGLSNQTLHPHAQVRLVTERWHGCEHSEQKLAGLLECRRSAGCGSDLQKQQSGDGASVIALARDVAANEATVLIRPAKVEPAKACLAKAIHSWSNRGGENVRRCVMSHAITTTFSGANCSATESAFTGAVQRQPRPNFRVGRRDAVSR